MGPTLDDEQGGAGGVDIVGAPGSTNSGGNAGEAGATQAGEDDPVGGAGGASSILADDSDAIQIDWFNFVTGGYRFQRQLDQLSAEQLELAKAITIVPSTDECAEDAVEMSITVTAGDTIRVFRANEYAGTCGRDVTLVDFAAASALLDTVHCLTSGGDSAESAPSIVPDDGCWHSDFNFSDESREWWFRTEIPTAGEYRIALDECGSRTLNLDLFEDDGTTEVASMPGTDECPVLTHSFSDAGSYVLRVEMLAGAAGGEFYLAVESTQ